MSWDVTSITEAEQVEPFTNEDVQAAEQEASSAEAEVTALEERVRAGDESVTHEQIERQRGLSRFAKLRAEAAVRKAERSKQAERLKQLDALRQEIEADSAGVGEQFAKALRKAEAALTEVFRIERERNEKVGGWRQRAIALDVPEHNSPVAPTAESCGLGVQRNGKLIAGERRFERSISADAWVQKVVERAKEAGRGMPYEGVRGTGDPVADARLVDTAGE